MAVLYEESLWIKSSDTQLLDFWWVDADQITFVQHPEIVLDAAHIGWTRIPEDVTMEL